jgi:tetratricopeptide (TPR) repeat protein
MRYSRFLLLLMVALLQFGCAEMQYAWREPAPLPRAEQKPTPRESAVTVKPVSPRPAVTIQPHAERAPVQQPALAEQSGGPSQVAAAPPAVLALMSEAEESRTEGNFDAAAAKLERALRIQPRNAVLWHELASVRLQQHKPRLAEDLAKKSNALARHDYALKRKNWALIARGRRLQGDDEGELEAERKARAF